MLHVLRLVLTAVRTAVRPRHDLVLENLLLRHQLAALTRPTRTRPRARLRIWDKLLWVLARQPDNRKTQAFYVGHLLKKFKIDDITTAVKTTWQLGGKDAKSELKYHQDTQLLIALGNTEQLSTAAEVLAQLRLAIEPVQLSPEKTNDARSADDKKGKSATQP